MVVCLNEQKKTFLGMILEESGTILYSDEGSTMAGVSIQKEEKKQGCICIRRERIREKQPKNQEKRRTERKPRRRKSGEKHAR